MNPCAPHIAVERSRTPRIGQYAAMLNILSITLGSGNREQDKLDNTRTMFRYHRYNVGVEHRILSTPTEPEDGEHKREESISSRSSSSRRRSPGCRI